MDSHRTSAKGNKRRAEKLLLDTRKSFVPPVVSKENEDISSDMLFADYMELWLEIIRSSVEKTTFSSYTQMVKERSHRISETPTDAGRNPSQAIQSFYLHELKTVSPGTVIHYHANIHKALKYAVKMDLIPFNPADKVERPKKQRHRIITCRAGEAGSVQIIRTSLIQMTVLRPNMPQRGTGAEMGRHRL